MPGDARDLFFVLPLCPPQHALSFCLRTSFAVLKTRKATVRSSAVLSEEALTLDGDSPSSSLLLIVREDLDHPCHTRTESPAGRPITPSDKEPVF